MESGYGHKYYGPKLNVDDYTETKITGYHARWPTDPDTTRRLASVGQRRVREHSPLWAGVLALMLIVMGIAALAVWIYWGV
jgi:hypothetical protein